MATLDPSSLPPRSAQPRGLIAWINDRTGLNHLIDFGIKQGLKPVPRNLSWAYTLGTLALFYFALQFFTGFLLLMRYSPGAEVAYKAVQAIQHRAHFGWLFRQMHSWGATFIVVVLIFHMLKVLWYGSYKRPREFTWFVGVLLLALTLGFCFTGYILPWNQLAKWATAVGTESIEKVPGAGHPLKVLVRGGEEVSGETLGRFFAVHVFLLPVGLAVLVAAHLVLIRLKGITPKATVTEEAQLGYDRVLDRTGWEPFFPRQVYRETLICILGFALLVTIATYFPFELGEPATNNTPPGIKPEWYFLPVYQFLKYFDAELVAKVPFLGSLHLDPEFFGIVFINLCGLLLLALPILDRGKQRKIWRRPLFAIVALAGIAAVTGLGLLGYVSDRTFTAGGKTYTFPTKGWPPAITDAAAPAKAEEKASEPPAPAPAAVPALAARADGRPLGGSCGQCHEHQSKHKDWLTSVHAKADPPVQCVSCHKGVDTDDGEEAAHAGMLARKGGEWRAPEGAEIVDICGGCHQDVKDKFSKDHLGLTPKRTCISCHSNHKVQPAGLATFEKSPYKEETDPRTARFRQVEAEARAWETERAASLLAIDEAKKFLQEREFPLAAFAEMELKAANEGRQVAAATHTLDAEAARQAVPAARQALGEVKSAVLLEASAIQDRRYLVLATWGVTLVFSLLLCRKLLIIRRHEKLLRQESEQTTEILQPRAGADLLRDLEKD